jgi:hypothetical protein
MKKLSYLIVVAVMFLGLIGCGGSSGGSGDGATSAKRPFRIKVKTDNTGITPNDQFKITTQTGLTYNYRIDCNDDGTDEATGVSGDYICDYSTLGGAGTYTIAIRGEFPAIDMYHGGRAMRPNLSL